MVNFILVQFLILLLGLITVGNAIAQNVYSDASLGERDFNVYFERNDPRQIFDSNQGELVFADEKFWQNYFQNWVFPQEKEIGEFLNSELKTGQICTNEQFSIHADMMRYAYRLITLSYLLESQWHLKLISESFNFKQGCQFNFDQWINRCHPRNGEMKKFITLLKKYRPRFGETLPVNYKFADWWKDYQSRNFLYLSHYRLSSSCKDCQQNQIEKKVQSICSDDERLMENICSENDDLLGLSKHPDAYQLIGQSNIINTFNKQGEALGCLRRYSMVMSHKEVNYKSLENLFAPLKAHLYKQYQERFIQGRVFFYGSGKEFELKGLTNLYFMEQPLKIASLSEEEAEPVVVKELKPENDVKKVVKEEKLPKETSISEKVEMASPQKSAFLQAAEIRQSQNLAMVEVDMLKLKYDYVFSLHMMNSLSSKLKFFMSRNALKEMYEFDKLGTLEGPVPLLFLKFMIDMKEHSGLYNVLSILGPEFFVSNEIDAKFKPRSEKIKLINDETTDHEWKIFILKP